MGKNELNKIKVKKLKIIRLPAGDVLRFLRKQETKRQWKFGEVYFSKIKFKKIKAWKYHLKTTMNLTVIVGKVKFVFYSHKSKRFKTIIMDEKKYTRLIIPPKIWFGFKGISKIESIIVSLTDLTHNPKEVLKREKKQINFDW